ncbi:uncharacterized protein [Rutidosis leptorrhynchoides]|uniref:uncharacterized protein n=1 Tax=Rutidosis leptorrhynchoides TaxID=125765 RepID=UPI003A9949AB
MDLLSKNSTSLVSAKPKFEIQGNDENELNEKLAYKLKVSGKKRSYVTDINRRVRKKKMLGKRNKSKDLQEQPRLSKSISFDSSALRSHVDDDEDAGNNNLEIGLNVQSNDTNINYHSPTPKFLKFNPDTHLEIIRQKNVKRFVKSDSFDCGMLQDSDVIIDESVGINEKHNERKNDDDDDDEEKEVFDDFKDHKGWNLNVFMLIGLILITLSIVFMNSLTHLTTKEAKRAEFGGKAFDSMMSMVGSSSKSEIDRVYDEWDKKDFVVNTGELVQMQLDKIKDVNGDESEESKLTERNDDDATDESGKVEVNETENEEEIKPCETKLEKESYSHINDKPKVVKLNNNGLEKNKIEGIKTLKFASFGTKFSGFIGGISLVILSVFCCSMMMKILKKFAKQSLSSQTEHSNYEMSPLIGSFRIKKKIIKKPTSKTPEVTISLVRRSSRIYNRSFTSSSSSLNASY